MKKLSIYINLLIGVSILFASCSQDTRLSLTKRHYRSGYYIDYVNRKPNLDAERTQSSLSGSTPFHFATNDVRNLEPNKITNAETGIEITQNAIRTNNPSSFKKEFSTKQIRTNKPNYISVKSNINIPATQVKNNFEKTKLQQTTNSDARSFFWLVITILLVLWLLALLTGGWGLGGLVHVLLVIALVLFILWLLRII